MIPIDILADEVARIYQRKVDAHDHWNLVKDNVCAKETNLSFTTWNSKWQNSIQRVDGRTGDQLTQFLSGHGGYRYYLHRFKLDESP